MIPTKKEYYIFHKIKFSSTKASVGNDDRSTQNRFLMPSEREFSMWAIQNRPENC